MYKLQLRKTSLQLIDSEPWLIHTLHVLRYPFPCHCNSFSEFCGQENTPNHLSLDAVPQSHCADYLLEPARAITETESEVREGKKGPDNEVREKVENSGKKKGSLVIFAVDISGSMCTTTEVPALQGI